MTTVLIIGPGAIGGLFAWHLQHVSTPMAFRHRPDLTLPDTLVDQGQPHTLNWRFPPEGTDFASIDLVLVTCKATQVEMAVTPLLPMLPDVSWLVCCNGLGPQQWLANQAPGRVLWGSTTEGALIDDSGRIVHTGQGETWIGPAEGDALSERTRTLGHWLCDQAGPLVWQWDNSPADQLWLKLAINAVINPITAVERLPNGALAEEDWAFEVDALSDEIRAIARACDHPLPDDLAERIRAVARATAGNHSSMRVDVEAGRPTEIEFINGFLIRMAFEADIKAPKLTRWYEAVLKARS
ncbi:ketopantoate reductase family protein [Saccharospirillum salsuginis]|uniref:2-dehydropantoate 2-reductase n=1 Tax=Saccharospirillum salsuginis TaxID=418750 RepID=A0A918KDK4_9GAMM|nr:ketopantoate reductase family protein [Saccharospirillum salsuginis]GGX59714.1 2-dehydropantoate 2-reductase [Saccharospirillum salsuginis]